MAAARGPPSNAALLEHVNFNLAPTALAAARNLYIGGLGLFTDPRPSRRGRGDTLLWANAGLQQVHLPVDPVPEQGEQPCQRLDGELELLLPPGGAPGAAAQLAAAGVAAELVPSGDDGAPAHVLVAPSSGLGNAFRLTEAAERSGPGRGRAFVGGDAAVCRGQPGFRVGERGSDGGGDGGGGRVTPLGLRSLRIRAPPAALEGVAAFWADVLGARVCRFHGGAGADGGGGGDVTPRGALARVRVLFDGVAAGDEVEEADEGAEAGGGGGVAAPAAAGAGAVDPPSPVLPASQWIDFVASPPPLLPYDGHHLALYLRDYEGAWRRAHARGLLYDNPRFSDRVGSWADAVAHQQFRTLAMAGEGKGGGEGGFVLELEIRSLQHPSCPL